MANIPIGVVVVTYNSATEAVDCLETLCAAGRTAGADLRVVVVDNASTDETVAQIRAWAGGTVPRDRCATLPFAHAPLTAPPPLRAGGPGMPPPPPGTVALLSAPENRGFAGGVNTGLACLAADPAIDHFWVLNPDSVVPPEAVAALLARLAQAAPYALMGGRVSYFDRPDRIQIDGGVLNRWTGVTGNLNLGRSHATTPAPDPAGMDFVMGASMVASRAFYEAVGPMREDYFLYYEEVDWAMRRRDLPLAYCDGLRIYHRAGTAIGSPAIGRPATPFSLYFKHRGRMRFLRRFNAPALPVGAAYTLAYAARLAARGFRREAWAVIAGGFGLGVPREVAARLSPAARRIMAGRPGGAAMPG